tara:strand:+ start:299 stop:469 length:171 start_codon:yes stop_codon:yes gene_type:complete
MDVKKLIKALQKLPKDLPIRTDNIYLNEENQWITHVECSKKGESGYEIQGEVRLLT